MTLIISEVDEAGFQAGGGPVGDQDAVDRGVSDAEHHQRVVTGHRWWDGTGDRSLGLVAVIDDQTGVWLSGLSWRVWRSVPGVRLSRCGRCAA